MVVALGLLKGQRTAVDVATRVERKTRVVVWENIILLAKVCCIQILDAKIVVIEGWLVL